jgi:integral membrane protein (TIGR01906 family)
MSLIATGFLSLAFTSIEAVTYDDSFYEKRFADSNTSEKTGLSKESLSYIVDETQSLLRGGRADYNIAVDVGGETREVFGDQENVHMIEVALLFQRFSRLRAAWATIAAAIALVAVVWLGKLSAKFFLYTLYGTFACLAAVGVWAALDFNGFFTVFHEILFSNDDWLFPASSLLIQILDLSFFIAFVKHVIALLTTAYALLLIIVIVFIKKFKSDTV